MTKRSNRWVALGGAALLMLTGAVSARQVQVPASGKADAMADAARLQAELNAEMIAAMDLRTQGRLVDQANQELQINQSVVARLEVNFPVGAAFSTMIPIEGQAVTLQLEPFSNLAPSFKLLVQQADGSYIQEEPGPIRTMRGKIRELPGSVVAASLMEEGLFGRIILADGKQYWIEPLSAKLPDAGIDDHAIFRASDVKPLPFVCGVHPDVQPVEVGERPDTERGATLFVAQIGCDTDFPFFQFWGSTAAVNQRIQNIINAVNVQYERDVDIRHTITTILVRSSSGADPYTNTTNPNTLLNQVANHWNFQQQSITRDVVQLFTARSLDSPVIGLASVGVVCNLSNAYSLVWSTCCGSFANTTDLTAHELGHNWNASHCTCPGFTMNPTLTGANIFNATSINQIVSFRNTRGCLNAGGPQAAQNPTPTNGATNVPTNQLLSWQNGGGATSYDVYFGTNPTPGVGQLIGNQGATSYNPGTLAGDTTYYWRIDARSAGGVTAGDIWSFSTPPPPPGSFNLLLPAEGSTIAVTNPLLDWSPSAGATRYRVSWANNPAFTNENVVNNVLISQLATSPGTFPAGGTYYWRVFAIGTTGFETLSTPTVGTFSVSGGSAPAAPVSPSPSDGATGTATLINLGWQNGGGATSYDIYFGTDSTPDSTEFIQNQTGNSYSPPELAEGTTYYWRIDGVNNNGTTTGNVWSFTTFEPAPNCPGDTNGDNQVNGADLSVLLGNFGSNVTPNTNGDLNGDGLVNGADLSVLLGNFGANCGV